MSRPPGASLVHPALLAALAVLVFNDHVLKRLCPGWLTGKLSDFAGLVWLPLFLHGVIELAFAKARGRVLDDASSDRWLRWLAALVALAFTLPELWEPAETAYRFVLGAARWPFRAAWSLCRGGGVPELVPVRATADVSDLLALPMVGLAYRLGRRAPGCRQPSRVRVRRAVLALLVLLGAPKAALAGAKLPFTHEGFYLALEAGAGVGLVDSTGSVSNGFAQEIPSSARGLMAPSADVEVGSSLFDSGFVLGGRLGFSAAHEPVIETLGERFKLRDHQLQFLELAGVAKYYPDRKGGLHFGAGLGTAGINVSSGHLGASFGLAGSLEAGHGFFFARQWSLGATARLTAARTFGRDGVDADTTFLMPALFASVTYH